ncbi:LOW QUALITY PROTEIN: hypothetical protein PHMEG_0003657 [Phytophthora megakarya]|uniref:DDE Tnp4 domain-containing protein n=1 Tax=Phytophthora megakarya TaxID=4795 RepID=A0A225WY54_9STRA|nr:LOW QUALITY PROTEIN: hypothetical protein PHMEG_0003657 [Phytophthora megakarya]
MNMLESRYSVLGSPAELLDIAQGFEQIAGFPGAVDGMLIRTLETSKAGTAVKNSPPSMSRQSWTPKVTSDWFLFDLGLTTINRRGMDQQKIVESVSITSTLVHTHCRGVILLGKLEHKSSGRICKVIIGCAVLHNLLILAKDTVVVGDADPLTRKDRMRTNEDFEYTDKPRSNLQG